MCHNYTKMYFSFDFSYLKQYWKYINCFCLIGQKWPAVLLVDIVYALLASIAIDCLLLSKHTVCHC